MATRRRTPPPRSDAILPTTVARQSGDKTRSVRRSLGEGRCQSGSLPKIATTPVRGKLRWQKSR
jgi:hypothetical protein